MRKVRWHFRFELKLTVDGSHIAPTSRMTLVEAARENLNKL